MAGSTLGPMCSTKMRSGLDRRRHDVPLEVRALGSAGRLCGQVRGRSGETDGLERAVGSRDSEDQIHNRFVPRQPRHVLKVAQLIGNGRIRVIQLECRDGCVHYPVENKIQLGLTSASTVTKQAQMVHECTHAAFDVHRYARSTVATSEAAGFVAECLFARVKSPKTDDPDYRIYSDDEKKDLIYELAWEIAGRSCKGRPQNPATTQHSRTRCSNTLITNTEEACLAGTAYSRQDLSHEEVLFRHMSADESWTPVPRPTPLTPPQ